jgi:serine/threonine protein phosphatase PrpC
LVNDTNGNPLNISPVPAVVPPMPLPITYATRLASYRHATEDRAVVMEQPDRLVIIVADGAGGIVGGGAAADAVVGLVRGRAHELADVEDCIELLREGDHVVQATGGETTAVLIVIDDNGLFGASCGDSEAWVIREDGSIDDLTQGQQKKRRFGSGRAVPVGFERIGVEGTLVVGSDGLYRYARPEDIVGVVTTAATPEEAAEGLVELVLPGSGELIDDVGVVALRSDEEASGRT